jgi:lysine biosynthesis protein LysW
LRRTELIHKQGETEVDLLTTVAKAPCPDCGLTVKLGPKPKEGRQLTCINCGAYLEIINLKPLELDWAFSDFEPDWDPDEKEWDKKYSKMARRM